MAIRYPDSRNRRSIEDGDEFADYVLQRLARSGLFACKCETVEDQLSIGDAIFDTGESVEIKLDARYPDTRRLSIEIAEKTSIDREWVQSGIYAKSEALWYCQGTAESFWLFHRDDLRQWRKRHNPAVHETETVRKFYLPLGSVLLPYWTLPSDISAMNFTSIPDGWVTDYEASL